MQVGIRLHDTVKLPLEERLPVVHDLGFKCAHVALSKVITENSVANSALTPGYAMYLKKLFAKNDLDIAVLGCYLNLANPNQSALAQIVEKYKAHIRFAAQLGCGVVGTETGAPNEQYRFVPECHTEEALQLFIKNVKPIVEYAEKMGVIFAIEPVFKHIVWNPKQARRVLDAIDSPNLQIIFDPVNMLDISNYEQRDEIFEEAMDLLGKDIAVLHLKDFVVENGDLKSIAAGTGMMNYEKIMKFVKAQKPYIHATLENTVPENSVQAMNTMYEVWRNA
ncbi:MAG: sugar phosphate isomerase/epimerase family protein [Lachnospiraceae bacterium]